MTIAQIINDTLTVLAPALPFLLKGAEGASEAFGKHLGDATLTKAKQIWHWLRPKIEERPKLGETVKRLAEAPSDPQALTEFRTELEALLHSRPEFVSELSAVLTQNTQMNAASASGKGSIAVGGNVSNSSLSTNSSD